MRCVVDGALNHSVADGAEIAQRAEELCVATISNMEVWDETELASARLGRHQDRSEAPRVLLALARHPSRSALVIYPLLHCFHILLYLVYIAL